MGGPRRGRCPSHHRGERNAQQPPSDLSKCDRAVSANQRRCRRCGDATVYCITGRAWERRPQRSGSERPVGHEKERREMKDGINQTRILGRGLPIATLLVGLGVCALCLNEQAAGTTRPGAPSPTIPRDTTPRDEGSTRLVPLPIRPACCMPPDPVTLEAVCRGDVTGTACQAEGGRPARSCMACGLRLLPESPEDAGANDGLEYVSPE